MRLLVSRLDSFMGDSSISGSALGRLRAHGRVAHQCEHAITLPQQGYRPHRNISTADNKQASDGVVMR